MRTPPVRAARRARGTCRRGRSPARREPAPLTSSLVFPCKHAEARDERFTEEEHPGHAGDRPRNEDERHRQLGELGALVPPETHELDSPPHEDQREREDEQVGDDLQERVRPRREMRQDVDHEMRPLAHADHRTQHDHPDEQEPRQLLGPDPRGDQRRVARDDLQRDRDDQDRHGGRHQPREQPMVAVEELFQATCSSYFVLLIAAKMLSAPISFAYASITGSTSFFICARSVKVMRFSLPAFSSASSLAVSSEYSTWRPYAPASFPARRIAARRAAGTPRKVFPEKQIGRIVIACSVMERLGPTS